MIDCLAKQLVFPKFTRATIVDPALAQNLSREQFPPLHRIVHDNAHDSSLHIVDNNWLSRIESLAVLASFPQAETTVVLAAPALKELVLHSISGIDYRAPHVRLLLPDWGDLPVLETLVFAGPSFTDASLEFVERFTQWPRLCRIILRHDLFRHDRAAQFPVRVFHPVPTHPLEISSNDSSSEDDNDDDDDDDAYLPNADDPRRTSFNPTAPRPTLTGTYHDSSAVEWPQLTRIIGALPSLRALQVLLTMTHADAAVIVRIALWVARVSKRTKARTLPVVVLVGMDVQETLQNRDAVERVLAELRL
ncbi:hypothetical protein AMAG_05407 [Allomyces macrogynus ATCC 38327]|uniref:Uncharacterized protein n=1 Tax=Allomyces macrogynus (strain ATCC 38327) TaxID=578462 RepID=A0A0L0SBQ6_ALLM3|nr:hypothetical protein AMAG_05407 [Allomyces macrogynus ATCC 38327]|eukprot:KNE59963.1 hypothetical protein AMAG_05407 [Allomyces macrogynus ATCC 38327]